jgi:hypothetical protein
MYIVSSAKGAAACALTLFTIVFLSFSVPASASWEYDGMLVYEQPTDLTDLTRAPLQLLVGLGVVVAAIAIFVLYRVRK